MGMEESLIFCHDILSGKLPKLAAKEKAEQDFVAKFKNLSVSLSTESVTEVPEETGEQNVFTDGIGEF